MVRALLCAGGGGCSTGAAPRPRPSRPRAEGPRRPQCAHWGRPKGARGGPRRPGPERGRRTETGKGAPPAQGASPQTGEGRRPRNEPRAPQRARGTDPLPLTRARARGGPQAAGGGAAHAPRPRAASRPPRLASRGVAWARRIRRAAPRREPHTFDVPDCEGGHTATATAPTSTGRAARPRAEAAARRARADAGD